MQHHRTSFTVFDGRFKKLPCALRSALHNAIQKLIQRRLLCARLFPRGAQLRSHRVAGALHSRGAFVMVCSCCCSLCAVHDVIGRLGAALGKRICGSRTRGAERGARTAASGAHALLRALFLRRRCALSPASVRRLLVDRVTRKCSFVRSVDCLHEQPLMLRI